MRARSLCTAARQRGVAAIEFAVLITLLLVIVIGIVEYGRALYYYNTIAKATRDATRLMSMQTPGDADYPALMNQARCTAVHGNPICGGDPLLPGLSTAMVSFCDASSCPGTHFAVPTGTGITNLVTVTVGGGDAPYTFNSLAPLMPAPFGVASFNFGPISVTMRQIL
jgi:Flp pilus assembly protein TadG